MQGVPLLEGVRSPLGVVAPGPEIPKCQTDPVSTGFATVLAQQQQAVPSQIEPTPGAPQTAGGEQAVLESPPPENKEGKTEPPDADDIAAGVVVLVIPGVPEFKVAQAALPSSPTSLEAANSETGPITPVMAVSLSDPVSALANATRVGAPPPPGGRFEVMNQTAAGAVGTSTAGAEGVSAAGEAVGEHAVADVVQALAQALGSSTAAPGMAVGDPADALARAGSSLLAAQLDGASGLGTINADLDGDFRAWLASLGRLLLDDAAGMPEQPGVIAPDVAEPKRLGPSDTGETAPDGRFALPVGQAHGLGSGKAATTLPPAQAVEHPVLTTPHEIAIRSVRYLVSHGEKTITVRLVPPSLGELQLEVSSVNDAYTVRLISPNPMVRDVLEGQVQGIREALARTGIELAQVAVLPALASHAGGDYSRNSAPNFGAAHAPPPVAFSKAADRAGETVLSIKSVAPHEGILNVFV